jgi:hypothetical protein
VETIAPGSAALFSISLDLPADFPVALLDLVVRDLKHGGGRVAALDAGER